MEYLSYPHQTSPDSRDSNSTSGFTIYKPSPKSTGPARGTACDQCHRCKVRCSGHAPSCDRCSRYQNACTYSLGKPLGKPKGHKNNAPRHALRQHRSNNTGSDRSRESSRTPDRSAEGSRDRGNMPSPFQGVRQQVPAETPGAISLDALDFFNTNNFEASVGSTSYALDKFTGFDVAVFNQRAIDSAADNPSYSHQSSKHEAQQQLNSLSSRSSRLSLARTEWENVSSPSEIGGNLLLQIITQLHEQQQSIAWAPINSTLEIAKQGLDAVSSYISAVPSARGLTSASASLLIACLLILQLSLSCYIELGQHAATRFEQNSADQQHNAETLCVGGFTIEDSESCRSVLDALVSAERKRGRTILVRLRQVAREVKADGKDKTGLLELLLDSGEVQ